MVQVSRKGKYLFWRPRGGCLHRHRRVQFLASFEAPNWPDGWRSIGLPEPMSGWLPSVSESCVLSITTGPQIGPRFRHWRAPRKVLGQVVIPQQQLAAKGVQSRARCDIIVTVRRELPRNVLRCNLSG